MNMRLLRHPLLTFMARLLFARVWRSSSWLRKGCTNGTAIPICPSHPMMLSISFAVVVPHFSTDERISVHAIDLLSGSERRRRRVSISHPSTVFCSSRHASELSLLRASKSSRGIGSLMCFGHALISMARRMARSHLITLLVPSMTIVVSMKSSMLMSPVPRGSIGMSTICSAMGQGVSGGVPGVIVENCIGQVADAL
jgi:hypothetical protein